MQARAATYYVIVAGLGGEPDYVQRFTAAANDLDKIYKSAQGTVHVATLTGAQATAAQLRQTLDGVARDAKAEDDFALVLIGHGTFDGMEYKFNLVGPDLSAIDIAAMCNRIAARRQLVVDTTSSSGGAVHALERPGRAVIAATKSGTEKNATVFARFWVEAFQDPSADTDKSDSISALEAYTYASKKTAEFYDSQKRLATEHAVFNDTGSGEPVREAGNGQGMLLSNFTLLRLGSSQMAANDPAKRALLAKKDDLEQKIDTLKYQKAAMDPADYKKQLTDALVELAKVQEEMDQMRRAAPILALLMTCSLAASAAVPADCWALRKHGHAAQAQACFDGLTQSARCIQSRRRLLGAGRVGRRRAAQFELALKQTKSPASWRVRYGMLLHERFNDPDAAEAIPGGAGRWTQRMPRPMSDSPSSPRMDSTAKPREYLTKAIALDPKLAEAHELLADLALTNDDTDTAVAEADKAIALESDALDAMAIHAAVELIADRSPDAWLAKIQAINPGYGAGIRPRRAPTRTALSIRRRSHLLSQGDRG